MLHVFLVLSIFSHFFHIDGVCFESLLVWCVLYCDQICSACLQMVQLARENCREDSFLRLHFELVFPVRLFVHAEDQNKASYLFCHILLPSTRYYSNFPIRLRNTALQM